MVIYYEHSEIRETLKVDLAELKKKQESENDELVLIKCLLSNLQRNRLKISREFLTAECTGLSLARKLAM